MYCVKARVRCEKLEKRVCGVRARVRSCEIVHRPKSRPMLEVWKVRNHGQLTGRQAIRSVNPEENAW